MPKPPERYQDKDSAGSGSKSGKEPGKQRSRHKSNKSVKSEMEEEEESSDDEISFNKSQISPALSVGSNSSAKKGKVGIAIKKSPNSDRSFETRLLGEDSDSDDEAEDSDSDEEEYEDFIAGLRGSKGKEDDKKRSHPSSSSDPDPKLGKRPRVNLAKVDGSHVRRKSALIDSDSEYEIEEVIELCEWYPPDFWKSGLDPKEQPVRMTDVTVEEMTVTLRESKSRDGFFKKSVS